LELFVDAAEETTAFLTGTATAVDDEELVVDFFTLNLLLSDMISQNKKTKTKEGGRRPTDARISAKYSLPTWLSCFLSSSPFFK